MFTTGMLHMHLHLWLIRHNSKDTTVWMDVEIENREKYMKAYFTDMTRLAVYHERAIFHRLWTSSKLDSSCDLMSTAWRSPDWEPMQRTHLREWTIREMRRTHESASWLFAHICRPQAQIPTTWISRAAIWDKHLSNEDGAVDLLT